jgi:hypothetical protein
MEVIFVQSHPNLDFKGVVNSQTIPSSLPFPALMGGIQSSQDFNLWNLSLLDKFQQRTNETIGMGQHKKRYPKLYIELSMAVSLYLQSLLSF